MFYLNFRERENTLWNEPREIPWERTDPNETSKPLLKGLKAILYVFLFAAILALLVMNKLSLLAMTSMTRKIEHYSIITVNKLGLPGDRVSYNLAI